MTWRRLSSSPAVLALVFAMFAVACSGDDTSTGSGGSANSGGSGAVAGAGAGGSAGAAGAAAGGSSGQMGVGGDGATVGSGGTGGSAGVGATGGGGGIDGTISALCDKITALPCWDRGDSCVTQFKSGYEDAAKVGCGTPMGKALECLANSGVVCEGSTPKGSADCQALLDETGECTKLKPSDCPSMKAGSGCRVTCADWDAVCNPGPPGALECSCLEGPNQGDKFYTTLTCDDALWTGVAEASCKTQ